MRAQEWRERAIAEKVFWGEEGQGTLQEQGWVGNITVGEGWDPGGLQGGKRRDE